MLEQLIDHKSNQAIVVPKLWRCPYKLYCFSCSKSLLTVCCSDSQVFCVGRYLGMLLVRHELIYVYVSHCILSGGLTVYTCELGQCESVFQHWIRSGALTKCQMENRFSPGQMVLDRAKFRLGEQEYPVELVMSSMTIAVRSGLLPHLCQHWSTSNFCKCLFCPALSFPQGI